MVNRKIGCSIQDKVLWENQKGSRPDGEIKSDMGGL